jgi:HSP20 family protein
MRQLTLGEGLDVAGIHASYENGVLTLTIPVSERSKPRKIQIQSGQSGAQQVTAGPGGSAGADVSSQGTQDPGTQAQASPEQPSQG